MNTNRLLDFVKNTNEEEFVLWMSQKGVYWSVSCYIKKETNVASTSMDGSNPYRSPGMTTESKVVKTLKREQYLPWSSIVSVGSEGSGSHLDDNRALFFHLAGLEKPIVLPFKLSNNMIIDAMSTAMLKIG